MTKRGMTGAKPCRTLGQAELEIAFQKTIDMARESVRVGCAPRSDLDHFDIVQAYFLLRVKS